MTVTINGVDYTTSVIAPTFKIEKEANYQNDIEMTIRTNDQLRAGMEIIVTDDSDIVFGGLLQTPTRKFESPTRLLQTVKSSGYKQILARRSFAVSDTDFNAGDMVQSIFDQFLSATGTVTTEEMTLGTISTGSVIASKIGTFNGYKLLESLAESSGYRWWVEPDKSFSFAAAPTYTASSKQVTDDDTATDAFEIFEMPTYTEDLSKYRTRQYVIGKDEEGNELIGVAVNSTEETRMAALFGSGVYGKIGYNDDLKTVAECEAAAQALLDANSEPPLYLTIKTRDFIDVNQTVDVTLDILDLSAEEFVVSSVSVKYDKTENWLYYEATMRKAVSTASAQSSWSDDWNSALSSRQYETAVLGDGTSVNVYVLETEPTGAKEYDLWVDPNDFSRYDPVTYTATATHPVEDGEIVLCNGTFTLTLPEIASLDTTEGVYVVVKNVGTGTITVSRAGSTELIDGASTYSLASQYDVVRLVSDGTDWMVI